jgi:hypothetical protein
MTLFFYPTSEFLFCAAFAVANGPILFSCITLNNAIVPHSFDKLTSSYIHMMPSIVMWAARWKVDTSAFAGSNDIGVFQYFKAGLIVYSIWLISYYIKIFSASVAKIEKY